MTAATTSVLRMSRRFDASPQRLFDAWTDPALVARWLFTGPDSERHAADLDVRVGGRWTITDRRDGVDYTATGAYLAVEPPHRLVFTFGMPQFSPEFARVIVEIAADGAGAIMTLSQESLPPAHVRATEDGWSKMFDGLAQLL
jgi:uncharacterized protein YndB with AHSA1/START domain